MTNQNEKPPKNKRRRTFWWGLPAVIFLAVVGLGLYFWLPLSQLIGSQLESRLAQHGIEAGFNIRSLGIRKATVTDIRLGDDNGIVLEKAELSYSLRELLADRHIREIEAEGLDIRLVQTEEGFAVPGLPSNRGTDETPFRLPEIPFDTLSIDIATVHVIPKEGQPLILPFSAKLDKNYNGRIDLAALEQPLAGKGMIRAEGISLESTRTQPDMLTLTAEIEQLLHQPDKGKAYFVPLHARGTFLYDMARNRITGSLNTADARERWITNHQIIYDIGENTWEVAFEQPAIHFETGILQPDQIFLALQGIAHQTQGTLRLSGKFARPAGGTVHSEAVAQFKALDTTINNVVLQGIDGSVRLNSLFPPATAGEQTLKVREVIAGIPLQDGTIRFALARDGQFSVAPTTWKWADGLLHTSAVKGNIHQFTLPSVEIRAEGLALQELLSGLLERGLSATGKLSGTIPLRFENGTPFITGGVLQTDSGGTIRYVPGSDSPLQKGGSLQTDILLQAMENFQYEGLRMDIRNTDEASLEVKLRLKGRNPDLYGGQLIDLNVTLTGDLLGMVSSGMNVYTLPEQLEKNLMR